MKMVFYVLILMCGIAYLSWNFYFLPKEQEKDRLLEEETRQAKELRKQKLAEETRKNNPDASSEKLPSVQTAATNVSGQANTSTIDQTASIQTKPALDPQAMAKLTAEKSDLEKILKNWDDVDPSELKTLEKYNKIASDLKNKIETLAISGKAKTKELNDAKSEYKRAGETLLTGRNTKDAVAWRYTNDPPTTHRPMSALASRNMHQTIQYIYGKDTRHADAQAQIAPKLESLKQELQTIKNEFDKLKIQYSKNKEEYRNELEKKFNSINI